MAADLEPCSIIDVAGDGNCFYRAVAVAMGHQEATYGDIKKIVSDFTIPHRNVLGNVANIE
jgi:hypothetical protein